MSADTAPSNITWVRCHSVPVKETAFSGDSFAAQASGHSNHRENDSANENSMFRIAKLTRFPPFCGRRFAAMMSTVPLAVKRSRRSPRVDWSCPSASLHNRSNRFLCSNAMSCSDQSSVQPNLRTTTYPSL